ncbi:MAG: apolipoprotein N-acyltransferase, partial [Kiloniellales bacterium]
AGATERLAQRLAALGGWRRALTAAIFGALAAAALPPVYLLPLLWPAFVGLLWLAEGARGWRAAFLIGWAFGFGYFLAGLYWVGIAFLVEAERFGLVMPFAVAALTAGLGLFPAAALSVLALLPWRGGARLLAFAALWLASEWLRALLFTGFPWNLLGSVWAFAAAPLQLAALGGVWGLSLMTLLAAGAPALLAEGSRRASAAALLFLLLPALAWGGGALRLAVAGETAFEPGVWLRIVQPNIPQTLKWRDELRLQHLDRQLALTAVPASEPVTHVIWSETAVPFLLEREAALQKVLGRAVPPGGLLITGAPRLRETSAGARLYNSLHVIDDEGTIVASYDKHHLVPFGEYMPLRTFFALAKLTPGDSDFSAGPGPAILTLPGLPAVSPLICYEVIFPAEVVPPGARPGWLLNLTNDAWFGRSSGPYQHFASARLRAVEQGLPLVRAAGGGISAVIDGHGRIVARLGLGQRGVLDAPLPQPLAPSFFALLGPGIWPPLLIALAAVLALALARLDPRSLAGS